VISGNAQSGIAISDNSSGITIQGNFIGTDVSGTKGLGNGGSGIVDGGSSSNIIGGTTGSARNVISANRSAGVQLIQPNLDVVEGNYIGTDVTGTKALGNGQDGSAGVFIQLIDPDRPANNTIGGTTSNARNVISGNLADGIDIAWYPPANPPVPVTHDIVEGNFIGTDASGANALGNGGNGVFISHLVRGDQVGGTVTGAGNVIAYNRQSGVLVGASNSDTQVHIAVNQNAMFSNGGLGIDLAPQGAVNCTTPPPGPNDYTPCPVIASASTTQVSGTACAHCMVEVFIATNQQDDLGHGEGQTFLGSVTTNASGAWSLTLSPGQVSVGQFVTATVTTSILPFETSEFATNIIVGA
jgi:titin